MLISTPLPGALAVSVVLLGYLFSDAARPGPDTDRDSEPSLVMYRSVFERLLKAYDRNAPVAVVGFMTSFSVHDVTYADGRHEFNVLRPKTGLRNAGHLNLLGAAIHMDGTFFLVKNLQHEAPPLGRVKKTVPLRSCRSDDPFAHRLWPFADEYQLGKPVTALAVFQSKATHILDAELIAPLGKGDIPVFEDFIEHLRTHPLEKITVHEAEALLDSPNHLLVWLGLIRLEKLKMLGARHYHRAILTTDSRASSNLFWEMAFRTGQYNAPRQELLDHLALLLKDPKKQAQAAKFLHDRFAPNARAQRKLAEVEQLQQLAKDYRDQNLAALQTRPDALAELDKFVAWRP